MRSGAPCSRTSRTLGANDPHGAAGLNLKALESAGITELWRYPAGAPQGRIPPSSIEMLGSPRINSALTSRRVPSPPHAGQAPNGELNENCLGSSSASEYSHLGQGNAFREGGAG